MIFFLKGVNNRGRLLKLHEIKFFFLKLRNNLPSLVIELVTKTTKFATHKQKYEKIDFPSHSKCEI